MVTAARERFGAINRSVPWPISVIGCHSERSEESLLLKQRSPRPLALLGVLGMTTVIPS